MEDAWQYFFPFCVTQPLESKARHPLEYQYKHTHVSVPNGFFGEKKTQIFSSVFGKEQEKFTLWTSIKPLRVSRAED